MSFLSSLDLNHFNSLQLIKRRKANMCKGITYVPAISMLLILTRRINFHKEKFTVAPIASGGRDKSSLKNPAHPQRPAKDILITTKYARTSKRALSVYMQKLFCSTIKRSRKSARVARKARHPGSRPRPLPYKPHGRSDLSCDGLLHR